MLLGLSGVVRNFAVGLALTVMPLAAFAETPLQQAAEHWFEADQDLFHIKLEADQLAGSKDDPQKSLATFDALTKALQKEAVFAQTDAEKLQVLRRFLYEAGPWNDNASFAYDMTDPTGKRTINKIMSHYLETRRGNCITMPMLAFMLGRKLGLKMTLAMAPLHVFIKWTDDNGVVWNLEATSGLGLTRDIWYRKNLPMSDQAVANGIYLRALSAPEVVGVFAAGFMDVAARQHRWRDVIAVADIILKHRPEGAPANAYVLAKRGSAYGHLLEEDLLPTYQPMFASYADMPTDVKQALQKVYDQAQADFKAAEALGWTPRDGLQPGEQ